MWAKNPPPPKTCRWVHRGAKHHGGICSPNLLKVFQLQGGKRASGFKDGPGWGPLTPATPPPNRFLCKKWKDLHVGDLVRLHDTNIVPVSCQLARNFPLLVWGWEGLPTRLSSSSPPLQCCFLPPIPTFPTPGRYTLTGQHGAQQLVLCGDSRHRRVRCGLSVGVWGPGSQQGLPHSPIATTCGSPSPLGYLGHSFWEHLWGTCKLAGGNNIKSGEGTHFLCTNISRSPAVLQVHLPKRRPGVWLQPF